MTLIPTNLIQSLVDLNNQVLQHSITHPRELAIALDKVAAAAWCEVEKLALEQDAENLAPSLRIDP